PTPQRVRLPLPAPAPAPEAAAAPAAASGAPPAPAHPPVPDAAIAAANASAARAAHVVALALADVHRPQFRMGSHVRSMAPVRPPSGQTFTRIVLKEVSSDGRKDVEIETRFQN
ncbi:MAG TPA: hypothetical protein VNT25_03985, partial [Allosphingosinicella sp.]|nr:hypothetical protein [Allosphingosinicella sp.]